MSVMGINLKTLRPEPCVEGFVLADRRQYFISIIIP
jgi:hypothetical protein